MLRICVFVSLLCICCNATTSDEASFLSLKSSLEQYLVTGVKPQNLSAALQGYELPHFFRHQTDLSLFKWDKVCLLCDVLANLLIGQFRAGYNKEAILAEVVFICTYLKIEDQTDIFAYIANTNKKFSANKICGMLLQRYNCHSDTGSWRIDLPPRGHIKKKVMGPETFNILQITDIHLDPRYTEGKKAHCGEPLCCQDDQETAADGEKPCGYWSEYRNADSPIHLLEEVIAQSKTHNFDYVYMTGDLVSHRVWETSIEGNKETIARTYDLFLKNFDVPVFPILGNHEPHPVNHYETIVKGGYYTVSPRKGFRVVALNNNVCNIENWYEKVSAILVLESNMNEWLLINDNDPYDQLKWLVKVLKKAEEDDEAVHILAHIPTGYGCYRPWSREYNRIIERQVKRKTFVYLGVKFAHVVTAQFYGHTHKDEFYLQYNSSNEIEAVAVGFNGASVNTDFSNPSYKIYTVDNTAYNVVDMFQYTFNLTLANEDPVADPKWYTQYSFKKAFVLDSMSPMDMDALVMKMARNHTLIDQQFRYGYRDSDWAYQTGCDHKCRKEILCTLVTSDSSRLSKCKEISGIYDDFVDAE
nr:unnamed protein product [Callosobruchus analis]